MKIGFFGSSKVSVYVLEELEKANIIPTCVITSGDKPQGRGLKLTPNVVKVFAQEKHINVYEPDKLDDEFMATLRNENCDLFVVASYSKILPGILINIPKYKTLNVHPSLLPQYRGASPIPTTMLDDTKNTGISIMRLDEQMDHGPIIAQSHITVSEWPVYEKFEEMMAREGGKLLSEILPKWLKGEIQEVEQDHSKATFTKKIKKEDGLMNFSDDPYYNFRKITTRNHTHWNIPRGFFINILMI